MKLTTIAAAALVLASTAARAEVSEITIAQQFGVSFLPLMAAVAVLALAARRPA